jgi:hypothetical protein
LLPSLLCLFQQLIHCKSQSHSVPILRPFATICDRKKNTLPVTATSATATMAGRSNNQTNCVVGTGSPKWPKFKDAQDGKIKCGCDTRARWNKSHQTNFYCPIGKLHTMPMMPPRPHDAHDATEEKLKSCIQCARTFHKLRSKPTFFPYFRYREGIPGLQTNHTSWL